MKRLLTALAACGPALAMQWPARAQVDAPAKAPAGLKALYGYEPTGLSMLRPYERGKVPVVFVQGLWSTPCMWRPMIEALEADPALEGVYQFWTFGDSTGDPIPYSAHLYRSDLDEVRRKLDPGRADPAFDRMVLVGHSMGGLLSKMAAVDSGERLWRVASDRPFREVVGVEEDRRLLHDAQSFRAHEGVRRVVYIATPHRGSRFDRGSIQRVGARLVRMPDPLRAARHRLVAQNPPDFFREHFRKGLPTSIDELEWGAPILTGLSELAHPPGLKVHSIIAVRPDAPPGHRTDGLVSFESAHVEGADSEKVIAAGHSCLDHPEVIAEVRRILIEHVTRR